MEYYKFEKAKKKKKRLKPKKKSIIIMSMVLVVLLLLAGIIIGYTQSENVRDYIDTYLFKREITTEDVVKIELDQESSNYSFVYQRNVAILTKNILQIYNNFGKKEHEIEITISNPIFDASNKYLVIAEKAGQRIYYISGGTVVWQKELEGKISKVSMNKNGYLSVLVSDASYQTIILTFHPDGKELFKTFLFTTYGIDTAISNDNKYLAIAGNDVSGSSIQSNVKMVSLEEAKDLYEDAIQNVENMENYTLINHIQFQSKNILLAMHDGGIEEIIDKKSQNFVTFDASTIFADVGLADYVVVVSKESSGLFNSKSIVKMIHVNTKKENSYEIDGIPKSMQTKDNIAALNLGSEVYFVNTNGWLVKKYSSSQEIKDVLLSRKFGWYCV